MACWRWQKEGGGGKGLQALGYGLCGSGSWTVAAERAWHSLAKQKPTRKQGRGRPTTGPTSAAGRGPSAPIATLHIKAQITRQGDMNDRGKKRRARGGRHVRNHPPAQLRPHFDSEVESTQTLCRGNATHRARELTTSPACVPSPCLCSYKQWKMEHNVARLCRREWEQPARGAEAQKALLLFLAH